MEQSVEKSEEQAQIIKSIAFQIMQLDVEYCRQAANDMKDQAHRQESMAVLNPSYPQKKNEILRASGEALKRLCDYVDVLKTIDKLKAELANESEAMEQINRVFN